ncbi:Gag protein [Phytophthora palmivora]|uniref:Gag protein n=1 Tax=Phytophthora palmivora TaxID=4796 RepID=A0A2P4YV18_9STRA|nr:Gag protein [Phytophthora palmivora]
MRRQAQCKELQQLESARGRHPWNWSSIRCYGCGKLGHMQRACPAGGQRKFPSKPRGSRGPWQNEPGELGSPCGWRTRLSPESLSAIETRKSNGGLLLVHASTVARNGDKFADALRESEGRGQVSVRLADGTVVNVPGVWMELAVKFEGFNSTESYLGLDMDQYDLILGMLWFEKHEPRIDWRDKAIGASRSAVSDRALVSNVPTSVRDWGARDGRQGAYAPEKVLGVTDPMKVLR